jgi:hypothetical protein
MVGCPCPAVACHMDLLDSGRISGVTIAEHGVIPAGCTLRCSPACPSSSGSREPLTKTNQSATGAGWFRSCQGTPLEHEKSRLCQRCREA